MARQLQPILDTVAARRGGRPQRIALTHPANWGTARREALLGAVARDGVAEVVTVTEPEAAAITTRPPTASTVAGRGGLRPGRRHVRRRPAAATDVDEVGSDRARGHRPPEGIDRLGGVDFDAAVLAHVNRFLDGALDTLDLSRSGRPPPAAAPARRLRRSQGGAVVGNRRRHPGVLPGLQTEVRMTRAEFEAMIRPALADDRGRPAPGDAGGRREPGRAWPPCCWSVVRPHSVGRPAGRGRAGPPGGGRRPSQARRRPRRCARRRGGRPDADDASPRRRSHCARRRRRCRSVAAGRGRGDSVRRRPHRRRGTGGACRRRCRFGRS